MPTTCSPALAGGSGGSSPSPANSPSGGAGIGGVRRREGGGSRNSGGGSGNNSSGRGHLSETEEVGGYRHSRRYSRAPVSLVVVARFLSSPFALLIAASRLKYCRKILALKLTTETVNQSRTVFRLARPEPLDHATMFEQPVLPTGKPIQTTCQHSLALIPSRTQAEVKPQSKW